MWGPRADLCEKLQGNIRLEDEYPCGVPGLISVRNYRGTSGWRVSTHMGAQGCPEGRVSSGMGTVCPGGVCLGVSAQVGDVCPGGGVCTGVSA